MRMRVLIQCDSLPNHLSFTMYFLIHYMIFLVVKLCPTLLQRHGAWPARLLRPQDSPNKHTGGGYHFLLQLYDLTFLIMTHGHRTV